MSKQTTNSSSTKDKKNQGVTHQEHPIDPVFDENSTILILGSFPSVLSRKNAFFYGHPSNRFWKVLSTLFCEELPLTMEEKKNFLKKHHIAVWDVIQSCDIKGSDDGSIQHVVPNDLSRILQHAQIQAIYTNGKAAHTLYYQYLYETIKMDATLLPSTSPRNASYHFERLIVEWAKIKEQCI